MTQIICILKFKRQLKPFYQRIIKKLKRIKRGEIEEEVHEFDIHITQWTSTGCWDERQKKIFFKRLIVEGLYKSEIMNFGHL